MVRGARRRLSLGLLWLSVGLGAFACSSSSSDGAPSAGASGTSTSAVGGAGSTSHSGGGSTSAGAASGGAAHSAGSSSGGTSATTAGTTSSAGMSGDGAVPGGGTGVTWDKVYVTWYGYDDNSCATEAQHTCANIAYPKSEGYPTLHEGATEGKGTYADPITFASAGEGDPESFAGASIKPGTLIYFPRVRKYFIMEDSCLECSQDWHASKLLHVDLWMGPSLPPAGKTLFGQPLIDCENNTTISSAAAPVDTIIVDPPADLLVDQTALFTGTQCTAVTY